MAIIPLSKPDLSEDDIQSALVALRGDRLSLGPATQRFETDLAARLGRPHAVAVSSGATALTIGLRAVGVGPGSEVLVPAFSYAANAHSVIHCGATPVFVDCDMRTLNMSAPRMRERITPRTRAAILVPVFGNPAGLLELVSVCNQHEIIPVENGSEGLGSGSGREVVGRLGRVACFGFPTPRPVCMGEGGAIVTHDDHCANSCRCLRDQGRNDRRSFLNQSLDLGAIIRVERDGMDARMPEVCAALGVPQLARLDESMAARQAIAAQYVRRLAGHPDLILPAPESGDRISWPHFWVRLTDRFEGADRDAIIDALHRHDIGAANHYPAANRLASVAALGSGTCDVCPIAERFSARTITLPMFNSMVASEIEQVCMTLEVVLSRHQPTGGEAPAGRA